VPQFVLDASVALPWCFEDERNALSTQLLDDLKFADTVAFVPSHFHVEVINVVHQALRRNRVPSQAAYEYLETLRLLPIQIDPFITDRMADLLDISKREGLSGYDAAYLELAKRLGLPLASFDADLVRAAKSEA